ncbi:hypothetical protein BAP_3140 [Bacillus sp. CN2]|nr:hypothetical protein BAP_3140 [Bacillus sp. CN2]
MKRIKNIQFLLKASLINKPFSWLASTHFLILSIKTKIFC